MSGIAGKMFRIGVRIFAIEKRIWEIKPRRIKIAASGITARVSAPAGGKAANIERMFQDPGETDPRVPEVESIEAVAGRRIPAAAEASIEEAADTEEARDANNM